MGSSGTRSRRPASASFVGDNPATIEYLAAPHPPRLAAAQRDFQACRPDRALLAERLRASELVGEFGEPEIGVRCLAGQRRVWRGGWL